MEKTCRFSFPNIRILAIAVLITLGCQKKDENEVRGTQTVQRQKIKIATVISATNPTVKALEGFKRRVEEKMGDRFEVILFPDSQLGSSPEAFDSVRRGDIEMGTANPLTLTSTIPIMSLLDAYYLFDNAQHAYRVLDSEGGQLVLNSMRPLNIEGLGFFTIGFRNFSNSKRPIYELEDVQGLKIRGYSPTQITAWEAVGANLSNVAWGELFTALQQNLIDGQETANVAFYSTKFYEVQKYLSLTEHLYSSDIIYANMDFMNSLSPEESEFIRAEMQSAIAEQRKEVDNNDAQRLEEMKTQYGLEVNEVPKETKRALGVRISAVISSQIEESAGKENYEKMLSYIQANR